MVPRGLWLVSVVAVAALLAACGAAAPAGRATVPAGPASVPARRATVHRYAPSVQASPWTTCFVAGDTCSIRPCIEFVTAGRPRFRPLVILPRPRMHCAGYPSPHIQRVFVRR